MTEENLCYRCPTATCGYIYDPKVGDKKGKIPPDTKFEDLPEDWKCPICKTAKSRFEKVEKN